ncbi:MAG: SGNH/GDSL hydrolase family protein [Vulcanimicrobiaceae bacterium]
MLKKLIRPLAVLSVFALAACGGGGGTTPTQSVIPPKTGGTGLFATMVGVGDSLTAGYQSAGIVGVASSNPLSILPGNLVPPTQENGWWALTYEQATGTSAAAMANPATSVLPLINAPGLGGQLIPVSPAISPVGFAPSQPGCDPFNQEAYQLSTALSVVRANPNATILDVAVPGQTAHEALYEVAPLTGPPPSMVGTPPNVSCPPYPSSATDPTAGGLQQLVQGESSLFYPILGGFAGKIQNLDQVDAAAALHPTLATVWLGANDLLKFTFSGGNPVATDSPAQMQADITQTIERLQNAGAKVVVANLPDILITPQFFQGGVPANPAQQCLVRSYVFCGLLQAFLSQGLPAANAQAAAAQYTGYLQTAYGVGPNGYLTESGFFAFLSQIAHGVQQPVLDPNGKGSGLGGLYLTDAFAAQVQGLNTAYNSSIAAAAQATGAPLVDMHALFASILQAGGVPINPPKCCSLVLGGGLLSFDGLHPSDTGYALVANAFIGTIDQAFGATVPPLSQAQIGAIYATDPYAPH